MGLQKPLQVYLGLANVKANKKEAPTICFPYSLCFAPFPTMPLQHDTDTTRNSLPFCLLSVPLPSPWRRPSDGRGEYSCRKLVVWDGRPCLYVFRRHSSTAHLTQRNSFTLGLHKPPSFVPRHVPTLFSPRLPSHVGARATERRLGLGFLPDAGDRTVRRLGPETAASVPLQRHNGVTTTTSRGAGPTLRTTFA